MRRRVIIGLVGVAAAGAGAWAVWPPAASPPPPWTASYDVDARPPEAIPPGTVVDRAAPPGWSHLVIKSLPRVRPSERGKVNDLTASMASWMFTAFLADVVAADDKAGDPAYKLRAVALGLGSAVPGRGDTVLTTDTAKQFGAKLDWISSTVLTEGYKVQSRSRVVLQGPTMALLDTPVWFRCGGKNRLVRFRYALLVDAPTGKLDVLVWGLDPDGGNCFAGSPEAVRLAPDTIDEAELVPDMAEFNRVGIPSDAAFAVDKLPPGRERLLLPDGLRAAADATRFTPDAARELESGLRALIGK